jgi:transcriptional regulator with XRE-family HTH domain
MADLPDKAILRARELFKRSGRTLDQIGQDMGYAGDTARKAAWQFLNKTVDPRLSMLRKFAQAISVPVVELLAEEEKKGRSK